MPTAPAGTIRRCRWVRVCYSVIRQYVSQRDLLTCYSSQDFETVRTKLIEILFIVRAFLLVLRNLWASLLSNCVSRTRNNKKISRTNVLCTCFTLYFISRRQLQLHKFDCTDNVMNHMWRTVTSWYFQRYFTWFHVVSGFFPQENAHWHTRILATHLKNKYFHI